MTPDDATRRQIDAYRRMTGEERLRVALGLHEISCNVARQAIRNQSPSVTDEQIEEKLRQRIRIGYEIAGTGLPR
jgi:hypothetical protein